MICSLHQSRLQTWLEGEFKVKNHLARPGVNFITVLQAAFMHADPESIKIQSSCQYLFTLLGSVSVKAVLRKLMKLTPDQRVLDLIILFCEFLKPSTV